MLFELLTGDFLFDPRSNDEFGKDEDHLAQMIETLGLMPNDWALSGMYAKKLLNSKGELKSIKQLKIWLLFDVMVEKYRMLPKEAESLCEFLLPMLEFRPEKRITAEEALKSPWLNEGINDYKMNDDEYQDYINESENKRAEAIQRYEREGYASSPEIPQEDCLDADCEDNQSTGSWFDDDEDVETVKFNEESYHQRFTLAK
jgi:serine/threonine protein kinase